ncbi:type II and III secretion system protein family protein [Devosia aquimaris]|uniref:type II and III secretion system protein family protein n=1 Tax=Devosia aquimaris TaxID=2866214 RepID=UPI001CD13AF4|nr:type II and III secretion system protein family protein [Devosia sp. CJK-A8-3]
MNPFVTILSRPARLSLGALVLGLAMASAGLSAQPALAQETHLTISPAAYGATKRVELELNKTMLVDLPAGAAEVVVSQPSVAAAIMRTRTRALVQGVTGGDTNIFFLDDNGRTIAVLDVKVIKEPSQVGNALEATLARVIPGSHISVESVTLVGETNRVVMTGTVLSGDDKDKATLVAEQFAGGIGNVANIIEVSGTQQVMLQVTVSEVKRDVAKQFGINLSGTLSVGSTNLSFNNTTTNGTNGVAGNFGLGDLQINAAIRALETRGALRILAQPTLTAISGQPAKFLAGGELPYVMVDQTTQQRTVIFKPYGVELDFTPVVKSNGTISLKVDTSVSDPQSDGSLTKRQANTSVELAAGTTLAIGGLLQETTRQQINQLPGLGNIPILGALFRSRDFQTQQTELVILVTPYLVQPSPANAIPVPTDKMAVPSDAESIFLGRVENMYGVAGSGEIRGSIKGSVGFVLD